MSASGPLIELRGVRFGYEREAVLEGVDLAVQPRDYLAILGPNGGGKTTLVKIMLGLLQPWEGEVIRRPPARRGRLGYVPQFSTFDPGVPLRVFEVVLMGRVGRRGLLRRYSREDRRAAEDALGRLRLAELARSRVRELSGGQLQRMLIARAIVADPAVLILDEPTASIDAESRESLDTMLEELNERIPIVIVTHDVTAISPRVRHFACVNRRLFYHGAGELTAEALETVYGCPVDVLGHGLPHRVLHDHGAPGGS